MSKYTLSNGTTITDADIDRLCDEFESESWAGHLERIHHGKRLSATSDRKQDRAERTGF